jgi:cytochrome c-type biogenesis protein CcmH
MKGLVVILFGGLLLLAEGAWSASQVDIYQFDNAEQQRRYKALIEEFRCPKCLNTNIAGSDAPIAQDLRRTVHKLVVTDGFSDQEVRDFLQQRYGDFVLYNPPFNARTVVIWLMPVALAVLGGIVLFLLLSRARHKRAVALDAEAQSRLQAILRED